MIKKIKKEQLFNLAIVILLTGISLLVIFKFVLNKPAQDSFAIKEIDQVLVTDLMGNEIPLPKWLSNNDATYFLAFDLKDCFGCISKGMEELKSLKNSGKSCFGLVIDDYYQDVAVWASNYEYLHFLVLKRSEFYDHIKSALTPVIFKIENGKVTGYRFITP